MSHEGKSALSKGFKDAFPVFISYFFVSIAVGINATGAGLSPLQASLMSFLNLTSAGQAAGIEIMRQHGTVAEIVLSQIAINLRYLLMGAALTIKLSPQDSLTKRLLMSIGITDENFALTASQQSPVSPFYMVGCYLMSMPGWVLGTFIGSTMGNIFPLRITLALSIALYAMFCAIIITPAKRNHFLLVLIIISMASSWFFESFLTSVSFGVKVIILTVLLSAAAAAFRPVKEEDDD